MIDISGISTQRIETAHGSFSVKRLDKIHPEISGNKWFKLKYNIEKVLQSDHKRLLTFGGAWSNHIYATAGAGRLFGIETVGVIRGEEPATLSATLEHAKDCGMQLEFVTRLAYAEKDTEDFIEWLHSIHGDFHTVPEGGSNYLGINGCMEILDEDDTQFDYICCPSGTSATLTGLILSAKPHQKILGFSVLKNGSFLRDDVLKHLRHFLMNDELAEEYSTQFEIITDYDFGGYAKWNNELISFINHFEMNYFIPLDQVYTGKMFYGVLDLLKQNYFLPKKKVLVLHTGGLQGKQSLSYENFSG